MFGKSNTFDLKVIFKAESEEEQKPIEEPEKEDEIEVSNEEGQQDKLAADEVI